MIIDDEYFNCEALSCMIKALNPELASKIDIALNGEEALKKVQANIESDGGDL